MAKGYSSFTKTTGAQIKADKNARKVDEKERLLNGSFSYQKGKKSAKTACNSLTFFAVDSEKIFRALTCGSASSRTVVRPSHLFLSPSKENLYSLRVFCCLCCYVSDLKNDAVTSFNRCFLRRLLPDDGSLTSFSAPCCVRFEKRRGTQL